MTLFIFGGPSESQLRTGVKRQKEACEPLLWNKKKTGLTSWKFASRPKQNLMYLLLLSILFSFCWAFMGISLEESLSLSVQIDHKVEKWDYWRLPKIFALFTYISQIKIIKIPMAMPFKYIYFSVPSFILIILPLIHTDIYRLTQHKFQKVNSSIVLIQTCVTYRKK